jgi:hypothetical protein
MPDVLWASAVELAREYGLSRTARALGLGYYTLQKRLAATGPSESPAAGVQSAFVELIPVIPAGAECTVELERPGEATMRIHIKSAALPDLEALTRMFWSAQA